MFLIFEVFFYFIYVLCLQLSDTWEEATARSWMIKEIEVFVRSLKSLLCSRGSLLIDSPHRICEHEACTMSFIGPHLLVWKGSLSLSVRSYRKHKFHPFLTKKKKLSQTYERKTRKSLILTTWPLPGLDKVPLSTLWDIERLQILLCFIKNGWTQLTLHIRS